MARTIAHITLIQKNFLLQINNHVKNPLMIPIINKSRLLLNIFNKLSIFYKNIIPSSVKAVKRIPTGMVSRAEIKDICSLPVPEAIVKATSVPLIFP